MAIERIDFPGGINLRDKYIRQQLDEIVAAHLSQAWFLPADWYPIEIPRSLTMPVVMKVNPEGEGTLLKYNPYRVRVPSKWVSRVVLPEDPRYYPVLRMPQDKRSIAITGGTSSKNKKDSTLRLYAYFFYTPGPSPLKSQP